jgi:hypothetical protein
MPYRFHISEVVKHFAGPGFVLVYESGPSFAAAVVRNNTPM